MLRHTLPKLCPDFLKPILCLIFHCPKCNLSLEAHTASIPIYCHLTSLGFNRAPHEPCCLLKGEIMVFFFVGNLIVAYEKASQEMVGWTIGKLREKY